MAVAMPEKESLRKKLLEAGAVAAGFAEATAVPRGVDAAYRAWLAAGNNAGMEWMHRHAELRSDPQNVLPGVRTIISLAFAYGLTEGEKSPSGISVYARGHDYHRVIKQRLSPILASLEGKWRICVDSAPLPERYWAAKAGIGFIGDNGALIVPGTGPEVFLAEILTDQVFSPDTPLSTSCLHCGACSRACPTGAMNDGAIDCRRCISYLTIEHPGVWNTPEARAAMATSAGKSTIFGCDRCVAACRLKKMPASVIPEFHTAPAAERIGEGDLPASSSALKAMLKDSPISRALPDKLFRNLENLK